MDPNAVLSLAVEIGGSDLDRSIALPAMARIDRRPEPIAEPVLSDSDLEACLRLTSHMQTSAESLVELVLAGLANRENAVNAATNRHDFEFAVERALKESLAAERGDLQNVDTTGRR